MKSKKWLVIAVSLLLVISTGIGVVAVIQIGGGNTDTPSENETVEWTGSDELLGDELFGTEPDFSFEHTTGDAVVDFDAGCEYYLDESLLAYLDRLETGVPATDEAGNYYLNADGKIVYDTATEKHVEGVLDNLITLINHFAKEEYSIEANHQIQRFYVRYYDRFLGTSFEDLTAGLAACFPKGGADPEILHESVLAEFGFVSGDDFASVFKPLEVAEIRMEFYNVKPNEVENPDQWADVCIYDEVKNPEDSGYERNLKGWLYNVISSCKKASLDEERIHLAQLIYAGSLADAEYRADWAEALIGCLSVEDLTFDTLKLAVEAEFGVCLDGNVPVQNYFETKNTEVNHEK